MLFEVLRCGRRTEYKIFDGFLEGHARELMWPSGVFSLEVGSDWFVTCISWRGPYAMCSLVFDGCSLCLLVFH